MTLKEAYAEAIKQNFPSLEVMIEFLILEKKVLTWESDAKELELYFKQNNRKRMNMLLEEYREKRSIA